MILTFLDNHKAAYIPVCIAGSTTSILTSEPAVAVWTDLDEEDRSLTSSVISRGSICTVDEKNIFFQERRGASRRRVGGALSRRNLFYSTIDLASSKNAYIDDQWDD